MSDKKPPLLADLLTEVSKFSPDYLIDEETDGNLVIILNQRLENSRLIPLIEEYELNEDSE